MCVIGSLGEDTRVDHVVGSAKSNWRRTVTLTRRKRMVAYIIACVTLLFAVMVRRRTLRHSPTSRWSQASWWQLWSVGRASWGMESAPRQRTFHSIWIRGVEESTDVRPLTWNCSRCPQCCGCGRHRQSAVSKGLFNDTHIVAPLKSPATASTCSSSITARIVRISFFPMPHFLAKFLLMWRDTTVKEFLAAEHVVEKKNAILYLVSPSPILLQTPCPAGRAWYREGR